jgi:hypothetical protein
MLDLRRLQFLTPLDGAEEGASVWPCTCVFLALFALALGPRYLPTTRLTTMAAMPANTALASKRFFVKTFLSSSPTAAEDAFAKSWWAAFVDFVPNHVFNSRDFPRPRLKNRQRYLKEGARTLIHQREQRCDKIQADGDRLMTRAVFLIGVGIVSAAIIGAAIIITTSMPRPLSMPQTMRVITETRKCFELRRFVEAQKEYISRSIDQAAYQKMTPQEKNEADTSLGRNLGDLDDMLERAGCD